MRGLAGGPIGARRRRADMNAIFAAACRAAGSNSSEMYGPLRVQPLVSYRQAAMAIARAEGRWSFPLIARRFNRDRTTAQHAWRRFQDGHLRDEVRRIRELMQ